MTQEIWNKLSFFEQLSNIDGEINRLIESHEASLADLSKKDYSDFYIDRILKLINMTFDDPKNKNKRICSKELIDEVCEIRRYTKGEVSSNYVKDYWKQYTEALG